MHQQKQQHPSHNFSAQQLNSENDQAENKYKQTDSIDTMHITDPLIFWTVRVFFPQVEIF